MQRTTELNEECTPEGIEFCDESDPFYEYNLILSERGEEGDSEWDGWDETETDVDTDGAVELSTHSTTHAIAERSDFYAAERESYINIDTDTDTDDRRPAAITTDTDTDDRKPAATRRKVQKSDVDILMTMTNVEQQR